MFRRLAVLKRIASSTERESKRRFLCQFQNGTPSGNAGKGGYLRLIRIETERLNQFRQQSAPNYLKPRGRKPILHHHRSDLTNRCGASTGSVNFVTRTVFNRVRLSIEQKRRFRFAGDSDKTGIKTVGRIG